MKMILMIREGEMQLVVGSSGEWLGHSSRHLIYYHKQAIISITAIIIIIIIIIICYHPEGRGSRPAKVNFFNLLNPSGRTMPWGLLSL
jgi:hypothetical protein